MQTQRSKSMLVASLILLLGTSSTASAAFIFVANHSFEELPTAGLTYDCGSGCSYSIDSIPGWQNEPGSGGSGTNSGQFRPGVDSGNFTYFASLSDGNVSAYSSSGGGIAQVTGARVQSGVTYTLLVDIGFRKDAAPIGVPRLLVNGLFYEPVAAPSPDKGGWATFTTTYLGRDEDAGLPITIFLNSTSFQGNFDNVRFSDSTVVPLPPALALFVSAFGLLVPLARRRRQGLGLSRS